MRSELEKLELITRYLRNDMPAQERTAFETELSTDSVLRYELSVQRNLQLGAKRMVWKAAIQKAAAKFKLYRMLRIAAVVVVIVSVIGSGYLVMKGNEEEPPSQPRVEMVVTEPMEIPALQPEVFEIDTRRDTVIETKGGIVVAIPENCFDTESNHVNVEIIEALEVEDILRAGLSTMSDDKLLETAGMFHIRATVNGVDVAMKKELIAEIPFNEQRDNMMLFDGMKTEGGIVNWVNPQPVEVFLKNVPVTQLDFYPPGYISKVKELKLEYDNKYFTDSLYYSMEPEDESTNSTTLFSDTMVETAELVTEETMAQPRQNQSRNSKRPLTPAGSNSSNSKTLVSEDRVSVERTPLLPSQVRAVWNAEYNGSLVGTREFAERVRLMHKSCDGKEVMELYLQNMEKPIWELDAMVSNSISGKSNAADFALLAERREGRVRPNDGLFSKLKEFYAKRQKNFSDAAKLARQKYLADETAARKSFGDRAYRRELKRNEAADKLYQEEFRLNFVEACRQLGYEEKLTRPPAGYYTARLNRTGWKNIDAYVAESLSSRTTLNYTDPKTGKRAVIEYKPATIAVANSSMYEKVYCYVIPEEVNSFVRMQEINETFSYSLNMQMNYRFVALAYQDGKMSMITLDKLSPGEQQVTLQSCTEGEYKNRINVFKTEIKANTFYDEIDGVMYEARDSQRRKKFDLSEKIRMQVRTVVYPCESLGYDLKPVPPKQRTDSNLQ